MFGILLFTLASHMPADSLRTETINGKIYVVHQVEEKETLYSISRRYGATILAILEQNPNADAGIEVGQILKVPYTPKGRTSAPVHTAEGTLHRVEAKETLFSIARLYNVSVDDIKAWNSLKDNSLNLGQTLLIKKKSADTPVVAQVQKAKTHTVAPKETLFSIARLYGVTWQQLQEWNGIKDADLKIGQVLSVAGPAEAVGITPVVTSGLASTTTTTTTTTMTTPVASSAPVTGTVAISEGVNGTDEIKETGTAELIEGSEGNRKYLAQHRTIKPGTIVKIRNLATNQEVFVRVTSPIPGSDPATIVRISKSAYDRLGATEPRFRAEITYYK